MDGSSIIDTPEQIAAFRLSMIRRAAGIKARTGMSMARNMPTVASLRKQYPELLGACRSYAAVEAALIEAGF